MNEQLSRLLSGELSPEEAARLRAQIQADPETAAAWARMQRLPHDLSALPLPSAPASLRDRVAPRRRWSNGWGLLGWGVAGLALAGLLVSLLRPTPQLRLIAGTQVLDGMMDVQVPGGVLHVDGKIRVEVEPPPGLIREMDAEDPMQTSHILAAAAGALLTIAVYEGQAVFDSPEGPIVVAAGETRTIPGAPPPAAPAAPGAPAPSDDPEKAALQEKVAALELQLAMARGQLNVLEGTPQPWPDDLPEGLRPSGFEATAAAIAAELPGVTLAQIDCEEYPCIAYFQTSQPNADWERQLTEGFRQRFGEDGGVWQMGSVVQRSDGAPLGVSSLAFSLGATQEEGQNIGVRLRTRTEPVMEQLFGFTHN